MIIPSRGCCIDCPDRFPACSDHCPKYQAEKAEREAIRQKVIDLSRADPGRVRSAGLKQIVRDRERKKRR